MTGVTGAGVDGIAGIDLVGVGAGVTTVVGVGGTEGVGIAGADGVGVGASVTGVIGTTGATVLVSGTWLVATS